MKILMIVIHRCFFPFSFFFPFLFDFINSLRYPSHDSSCLVSPQISNNHRVSPFENPFNCVRALSISIELLPMLIRDTDISTGIWIYLGHRLSLPSDRFIVHSPIPHYSSLHQRYSNGIKKKADLESTVRTFFPFFSFFYSRTKRLRRQATRAREYPLRQTDSFGSLVE